MEIKRIPAGVYAANCYILIDETSKECAVIDPGGDGEDLIKIIKDRDLKVKFILLTHGHADHMGAVSEIKEAFKVPAYINKKDGELVLNGAFMFGAISPKEKLPDLDMTIKEGSILKVGNTEIEAIETPGHSPGGMCFLVEDSVITGDTLFLGSIGRSDLTGGDHDTLIKSIKSKLMILKDDTIVLPGHGPQSSIKYERLRNPYL